VAISISHWPELIPGSHWLELISSSHGWSLHQALMAGANVTLSLARANIRLSLARAEKYGARSSCWRARISTCNAEMGHGESMGRHIKLSLAGAPASLIYIRLINPATGDSGRRQGVGFTGGEGGQWRDEV